MEYKLHRFLSAILPILLIVIALALIGMAVVFIRAQKEFEYQIYASEFMLGELSHEITQVLVENGFHSATSTTVESSVRDLIPLCARPWERKPSAYFQHEKIGLLKVDCFDMYHPEHLRKRIQETLSN